MKAFFLMGLVVLMPFAAVMAQSGQWEDMHGPYFIDSVTSVSIGYQSGNIYSYAVGSDFQHEYIYSHDGDLLTGQWSKYPEIYDGLKYVSASKFYGQKAYISVPENAGPLPGVRVTNYWGVSWSRYPNQPGNLQFTGIAAHPNSNLICFTSSKHVEGVSSIYKTENGGQNWGEIGSLPSANDCNAVYIDPNSGNQLSNTTIYACFQSDGIYKSANGGGNWSSKIDFYGDSDPYNGVCVAVKEGTPSHIFAITWREGEHYLLWYSFDNGDSWDSRDVFGNETVKWLDVIDSQGNDEVAALTPTMLYRGIVDEGMPGLSVSGPYMLVLSACWDTEGSLKGILIGQDYSIYYTYNAPPPQGQTSEEIIGGTNIAQIVSLDCAETGGGSVLETLSKIGGFVYYDHNIYDQNSPPDWEFLDVLQKFTSSQRVIGGKLSCFLTDLHEEDYIASGQTSEEPITSYISVMGDRQYATQSFPNPISAIDGPRFDHYYAGFYEPVAGKDDQNSDRVWFFWQGTEHLGNIDWPSNQPPGFQVPEIKDVMIERGLGPSQLNYYICGDNSNPVVFRNANPFPLINGLTGVSHARAISESREIPVEDTPATLYLGTELGIYKNKFDLQTESSPWYLATYGIGQGITIDDIDNYYHIIQNSVYYKPDSIVQYSLGHDNSNNPYLYISADSGRSWNEIGDYFRNANIQVNDLATFPNPGFTNLRLPVFLGIGTDKGVYRYPYNVKSGTLSESETWGPGLVVVNGDVTVPVGKTLTVEPGTDVKFVYNFDRCGTNTLNKSELIVSGTLNAYGQQTNPIVFESSHPYTPSAGQWYGIRPQAGSVVNMDYCQIKHASYAIKTDGLATLSIEHTLIDQCLSEGIYLNGGAGSGSPNIIRYCRIQNCGTNGIYASDYQFTAEYDTIQNVKYGIHSIGTGAPIINSCRITNIPGGQTNYGISITENPSASPQINSAYI